MITASDYRKRSRKTITIPSGGELEIRKLSVLDFLSVGEIPAAFRNVMRSGDKAAAEAALKSDPALWRRINTAILISSVVSMKIVDKPTGECSDDEVSVAEIDPADQDFIMNEINAMNSMGSEGGKLIGRFPEESVSPSGDRCDGEAVREAADGSP